MSTAAMSTVPTAATIPPSPIVLIGLMSISGDVPPPPPPDEQAVRQKAEQTRKAVVDLITLFRAITLPKS